MRSLALNLGRVMASLALSTGALLAQDSGPSKGFDAQFKLRAGVSMLGEENEDHLTGRSMGFGLDFGYTFDFGRFGAEVGYQYMPGDQYIAPFSTPAAGANPPVSSDPVTGTTSVDSRKNTLQGVTLRLSFQKDFASDWGWQAGVQLGGSRFKQEYIADITDLATYEDTYQGSPTKSSVGISPYIGVMYRATPTSHIELNVISVGYKAIDFIHHPGSVQTGGSSVGVGNTYAGDTLAEYNRRVLQVEIGYAFHF